VRQRELGGHQGRTHVQIEHVGKKCIVDFRQRFATDQTAGVIDQHVDAAQTRDRVVHQLLATGRGADVRSDKYGFAAIGLHAGQDGIHIRRRFTAIDGDFGATTRKSLRGCKANAHGRTGNQHALAGQIVEHASLLFTKMRA